MQVFDIPPAALTVTQYQMMCRTCGCGQVTTAPPPPGVTGGPVCYGPGVVAAATLLAGTDVIGIERAADLMGALLQAPVSTGFVSRCLARLDAALTAAGFEDTLKDALRAADVPGTGETPAPLPTAAASAEGCGNPHVYTVRTMRAYTGGGPALAVMGRRVYRARCIIVLQGQPALGIRPRACAAIRYVVRSYDLARHAAAPLGATRLVRQRLPDEGKSSPIGPGFLDGSVSQRQPLPWPGI